MLTEHPDPTLFSIYVCDRHRRGKVNDFPCRFCGERVNVMIGDYTIEPGEHAVVKGVHVYKKNNRYCCIPCFIKHYLGGEITPFLRAKLDRYKARLERIG